MKDKNEKKPVPRYPLCKGAYCACQERDCIYYEFIHYKTRQCRSETRIAELEKSIRNDGEFQVYKNRQRDMEREIVKIKKLLGALSKIDTDKC